MVLVAQRYMCDISLTFEDKHILEQGEKLTDKHIKSKTAKL